MWLLVHTGACGLAGRRYKPRFGPRLPDNRDKIDARCVIPRQVGNPFLAPQTEPRGPGAKTNVRWWPDARQPTTSAHT